MFPGDRHVHVLLHPLRLLQPHRVRHRQRDDGGHQRHRKEGQGQHERVSHQEHGEDWSEQTGSEDNNLYKQGEFSDV